jgi:hypothetical protein
VAVLLLLTLVGAFTERQAIGDLLVTGVMGALGLAMVRYEWPRAPLILGVVLGPLAENRLFLSVDAYGGGWTTRPGVLVLAAAIAAGLVLPARTDLRLWKPSLPTEPASARPASRGEAAFALPIAALLAAMWLAAGSYPPQAAMAPRLIAAVTVLLVLAALLAGRRSPARPPRVPEPPGLARSSLVTAAWIPAYVALIWGFGFLIGGPLAIFGYLVSARGERPGRAIALAVGAYAVLDFVLFRLLDVAFPRGALLLWAGGLLRP